MCAARPRVTRARTAASITARAPVRPLLPPAAQIYALSVLALFYINTKEWLEPLSPLYKFGIIKLIIFVLFWQAVAIVIAGMIGLIHPFWGYENEEEAAAGLQDFIVTIEVFIFSVLHHFYFSYKDFYSVRSAARAPPARAHERGRRPLCSPPPSCTTRHPLPHRLMTPLSRR